MHESNSPALAQVLELTVQNHPGVMVHIAGLFARRAFNLEGILCGPVGDGERSQMLLLIGADARLEQVIRQLEKLHDVITVTQRSGLSRAAFQPANWPIE